MSRSWVSLFTDLLLYTFSSYIEQTLRFLIAISFGNVRKKSKRLLVNNKFLINEQVLIFELIAVEQYT